MADAALRAFASDALFALLGYAEASLVAFVIALGAWRVTKERTRVGVR